MKISVLGGEIFYIFEPAVFFVTNSLSLRSFEQLGPGLEYRIETGLHKLYSVACDQTVQ